MRFRHGGIGDRHLVRVIGRAADQILLDIEISDSLCRAKGKEPLDLGHDLRTDAVAGEQKELVTSHARRPGK